MHFGENKMVHQLLDIPGLIASVKEFLTADLETIRQLFADSSMQSVHQKQELLAKLQ